MVAVWWQHRPAVSWLLGVPSVFTLQLLPRYSNSRFDSPQRRSFVAIRLVDALPTSFPGRVFLARDEKLTIRKCRSEWMLVQLYRGSRSSCTRTGVISSATGEFPAAEDELAD